MSLQFTLLPTFSVLLILAVAHAALAGQTKCLFGKQCANKTDAASCGFGLYCCPHTGNITCVQEGSASFAVCNCEEFAESYDAPHLNVMEKRDACSSNPDCASCSGQTGCGWCASTLLCLDGTAAGPSTGSCAVWGTSPDTCTENQCLTSSTCSDCTGNPYCGWCANTNMCHSGDAFGPSVATCPSSWQWSTPSCDACHRYTECSTCLANSGVCGWCPSASTPQQCMSGTAAGPNQGNCGDWGFELAVCYPNSNSTSTTSTGTSGTTILVTTGTTGTTGTTAAPRLQAELRDQALVQPNDGSRLRVGILIIPLLALLCLR